MLARVANLENQLAMQRDELRKQSSMIAKIFEMMSSLHNNTNPSTSDKSTPAKQIASPQNDWGGIDPGIGRSSISSCSSTDDILRPLPGSPVSCLHPEGRPTVRASSNSWNSISISTQPKRSDPVSKGKSHLGYKRKAVRATKKFIKHYYGNASDKVKPSRKRIRGTSMADSSSSRPAPAMRAAPGGNNVSNAAMAREVIPQPGRQSLRQISTTTAQQQDTTTLKNISQCRTFEDLQGLLSSATHLLDRKRLILQLLQSLSTLPSSVSMAAEDGESASRPGRDFYRDFLCFRGGQEMLGIWLQQMVTIVPEGFSMALSKSMNGSAWVSSGSSDLCEAHREFISLLLLLMEQVSWSHAQVVKTRVDKAIRSLYKLYISRGQEQEGVLGLVTESSAETEFAMVLRQPWAKYREIFLNS